MTGPGTDRVRVLIAALAAGSVLLVPAAPAAAHSELAGSVPVQDEVVAAAPSQVRLTFVGEVADDLATVVVTGPDGADLAAGAPSVEGGTVTQPVRPAPGPGAFQVAYRVVADDGHVITGTVSFTAAASAPATATTPATAAPPTGAPLDVAATPSGAAAVADASTDDGGTAAGALVLAGLAALAGVAVLLTRRSGASRAGRP